MVTYIYPYGNINYMAHNGNINYVSPIYLVPFSGSEEINSPCGSSFVSRHFWSLNMDFVARSTSHLFLGMTKSNHILW